MNHFARRLLVGFAMLFLTLPGALFGQQGFASLEEQMTGEEFRAAGLEKLSPEELAALNQWIRSRSLATLGNSGSSSGATMAGSGSADRVDIEDMPREEFTTRISGTFSGWDGQTVFKLQNGMIWAQADKDKFYTEAMENPLVTIEPALFGAWKLSVEGHDENCRVERIQ